MVDVQAEERLKLLFRRSGSLPELPDSCVRLMAAVDAGDANAAEIERIIAADPSLAACLFRHASYVMNHPGQQVATLRMAIMQLGLKEIRALASSLLVQRMLRTSDIPLDMQRYALNGIVTAILARYMYARHQRKHEFASRYSAEQIFAGGILHMIALPLLAKVSPEEFARVKSLAMRTKKSFAFAFQRIFGSNLSHLGAHALAAWCLPPHIVELVEHFQTPWTLDEEFTALSCLNYATFLAWKMGFGLEPWLESFDVPPEVEMEVGLEPAEIEHVAERMTEQLQCYLSELEPAAA